MRKSDYYTQNLSKLADDEQFISECYRESQIEDDWVSFCIGDTDEVIDNLLREVI